MCRPADLRALLEQPPWRSRRRLARPGRAFSTLTLVGGAIVIVMQIREAPALEPDVEPAVPAPH
jgi:hypothetical protein